jgi:hypothetical protein
MYQNSETQEELNLYVQEYQASKLEEIAATRKLFEQGKWKQVGILERVNFIFSLDEVEYTQVMNYMVTNLLLDIISNARTKPRDKLQAIQHLASLKGWLPAKKVTTAAAEAKVLKLISTAPATRKTS